MRDAADQSPPEPMRPDRRRFFLLGLNAAFNTLSEMVGKTAPALVPTNRNVLRPPGAIEEKEFLRTCYRCGSCIDACPAHAIKPLQVADEEQTGSPFIDPDIQACRMCEDLPCTRACPSGALARLTLQYVRMGTAHVLPPQCLRTNAQQCRFCLDRCPVSGVIRLGPQGQVEILTGTCTGCGTCQQVCPARPKAIRVEPL